MLSLVCRSVEKEQTVFHAKELPAALVPKIHEIEHRKRAVIGASKVKLVEGFEKDRLGLSA